MSFQASSKLVNDIDIDVMLCQASSESDDDIDTDVSVSRLERATDLSSV